MQRFQLRWPKYWLQKVHRWDPLPVSVIVFSLTMEELRELTVYYFKTFKKVMNVQTPKEKSTLAMWLMIENSNNIRLWKSTLDTLLLRTYKQTEFLCTHINKQNSNNDGGFHLSRASALASLLSKLWLFTLVTLSITLHPWPGKPLSHFRIVVPKAHQRHPTGISLSAN